MRKPDDAFDDPAFLARLRQGEEAAYRTLIRRFHASLVRVAGAIIGSHAQAEEVVQDAWLAVFAGIARFEGRSSLSTWVFTIVLNRARTRIGRESRTIALPAILDAATGEQRAVPLSAFKADGHWLDAPALWEEIDPERDLGGRQLWDHALAMIERLPAGQKAVITLRDLEGQDAQATCALLGISAENQRVLLHRARGRVRQGLDALLRAPPSRGTADPTPTPSPGTPPPTSAPARAPGTRRRFLTIPPHVAAGICAGITAGITAGIRRWARATGSARRETAPNTAPAQAARLP